MTDIRKSITKEFTAFGEPSDADMERISPFLKKELKKEELFVFSVTLCDNDIDRDFERFSEESLRALAPLMLGKTGICDHEMKAQNQTARLFDTLVEQSETELNALNAPLVRLKGRAYMLRTEGNREAIAQIEGGIRKEVSISCSVRSQICSICGEDIRVCNHVRGREYGKKLCYAELRNPADGYEWSFVAVPAQKNAGVTKSKKEVNQMEKSGEEFVKSVLTGKKLDLEEGVKLSKEQAISLGAEFDKMSTLAKEGEKYLDFLRKEVKTLTAKVGLCLSEETLDGILMSIGSKELLDLKKGFEEKASRQFHFSPQTAPQKQTEEVDLEGYTI